MNKENLKKLLLSLKEEDYPEKADFHIHSNLSDGIMTPYEITAQAEKSGGKYIAIADHNTIEAYLASNILSKDFVIPSVEFDCFYSGIIIHILGLGINIDNKEIQPLFARSEKERKSLFYRLLRIRSPKNVITKIKQAGGIPVLAHPERCFCINFDFFIKPLVKMGLEGIEAYYFYKGAKNFIKFCSKEDMEKAAEKYNLIKTGGTDTHGRFN